MMNMLTTTLAAAVGTIGFSVLFGVPGKCYLLCGLAGGAGWMGYLLLSGLGATTAIATCFATMLVILMSRFMAVAKRCPATLFIIPGIFPLVPGAGIYWTAYYLVVGKLDQALASGTSAIKAALAIVIGIVVIYEIPGRFFFAIFPKAHNRIRQ